MPLSARPVLAHAERGEETLLVRKDGEHVPFLNQLRHRPDQALTLRIPLTSAGRSRRPGGPRGDRPLRGAGLPRRASAGRRPARAGLALVHGGQGRCGRDPGRGPISRVRRVALVVLSILMTGGMAALVFNYRQRSLYQSLYRADAGTGRTRRRFAPPSTASATPLSPRT